MNMILNNRGEVYILTCVIILIVLIMFSLIFTYISINVQIENERRMIETELENYLTSKAETLFGSLKKGYISLEEIKAYNYSDEVLEYIDVVCPENMKVFNVKTSQDTENGIEITLNCDFEIIYSVFSKPYTYEGKLKIKVSYIPIMN